jgi:hypothetical protein
MVERSHEAELTSLPARTSWNLFLVVPPALKISGAAVPAAEEQLRAARRLLDLPHPADRDDVSAALRYIEFRNQNFLATKRRYSKPMKRAANSFLQAAGRAHKAGLPLPPSSWLLYYGHVADAQGYLGQPGARPKRATDHAMPASPAIGASLPRSCSTCRKSPLAWSRRLVNCRPSGKRGFSSETFCFNAIDARGDDPRDFFVYYLGDFDRAAGDAARSLEKKLNRFATGKPFSVWFEQIAVTEEQILEWRLPTREPKRKSAADRKWPHSFACEVDAIPADRLRALVRDAIERHLPRDEFERLKIQVADRAPTVTGQSAYRWSKDQG